MNMQILLQAGVSASAISFGLSVLSLRMTERERMRMERTRKWYEFQAEALAQALANYNAATQIASMRDDDSINQQMANVKALGGRFYTADQLPFNEGNIGEGEEFARRIHKADKTVPAAGADEPSLCGGCGFVLAADMIARCEGENCPNMRKHMDSLAEGAMDFGTYDRDAMGRTDPLEDMFVPRPVPQRKINVGFNNSLRTDRDFIKDSDTKRDPK